MVNGLSYVGLLPVVCQKNVDTLRTFCACAKVGKSGKKHMKMAIRSKYYSYWNFT